jgi:tRNA G46 methylase TrmB
MKPCVICADETIATVERAHVPTLQNRVYSSPSDALAAKYGRLQVQACRRCGHAFNAAFDSALLVYDEHYNNDVPSPTFADYYRKIATHFRQQYLPHGGKVLDIGCGKGQFLQTLAEMFADVHYCLGINIFPRSVSHA